MSTPSLFPGLDPHFRLTLCDGLIDRTTWWKDENSRVPCGVWWLDGQGVSRPATDVEIELWLALTVASRPKEANSFADHISWMLGIRDPVWTGDGPHDFRPGSATFVNSGLLVSEDARRFKVKFGKYLHASGLVATLAQLGIEGKIETNPTQATIDVIFELSPDWRPWCYSQANEPPSEVCR